MFSVLSVLLYVGCMKSDVIFILLQNGWPSLSSLQNYKVSEPLSQVDGQYLWTCLVRKLCRTAVFER